MVSSGIMPPSAVMFSPILKTMYLGMNSMADPWCALGLDVRLTSSAKRLRSASAVSELALRRADWAMAIEAGEHVPREHEGMFVRNLHAHNCRGVVLSWAKLNQGGHGHVNTHDPAYVRAIFHDLGYVWDKAASEKMYALMIGERVAAEPEEPAENRSLQVLRRRVTPAGCTRLKTKKKVNEEGLSHGLSLAY